MTLPVAVLASTRGTDLQAIIDSVSSGSLNGVAEISCVICDRECPAEEKARAAGIPTYVLDKKSFATREDFDKQIVSLLQKHDVQLVCLAGYLRLLSSFFVQSYAGRIINVHPSLLPAFPGGIDKSVHQLVIDYGAKASGCTFHFVDESVDGGPIIAQAAVSVLDDDTADTLKERVQEQEKRLYPLVIAAYAKGMLEIEGRRVKGMHTP